MIKTEAVKTTGELSKADAKALTERIRNGVEDIRKLVVRAREGKAWKVLGHASWEAYVKEEFGMSRVHAHRLEKQGEVIEAIEKAVGDLLPMGNISERVTRELRSDLPAATAEIRQRAEKGEKPEAAAKNIAVLRRAEKEKAREERKAEQAKNDMHREQTRAALPPHVQRAESYKANGAVAGKKPTGLTAGDRIAELEEANRALEAEVVKLRAENKMFSEMKAEFDKGGFAEVIRGKDETIRAQATRIERESQEKVRNLNTSEMWRKRAEEAGWSNDVVIDLEDREAAHG